MRGLGNLPAQKTLLHNRGNTAIFAGESDIPDGLINPVNTIAY